MYRKLVGISIILSLLSFNLQAQDYQIHNGILDLRLAPAELSNPIKLKGEVEFFWKQLLEPSDFANANVNSDSQLVTIPKVWTTYRVANEPLPPDGYATYRFKILCPASKAEGLYGLRISSIFSSYRIWANGVLINAEGDVGRNANEHSPRFSHKNIPIQLDSKAQGQIEIVVQVSNFSHRRAGLFWPMHFGTLEVLTNDSRSSDIINLIIIGLILVIGLNHLNIYLFRRKERSNLLFGLICLVMILRNLTTGDRVLGFILPNLSWNLIVKLDNFSGFGTIPIFALFFYNLYKQDFPKWLRDTIVVIGVIISLLVFTTPPMLFGKFRLVFELYTLLGGLYLTFGVLLPASIKKRPSALLSFLGLFILYATAVNDVLSSMNVIQTAYIAHYGLAAFMLIQSAIITSKSAIAINRNEILGSQLEEEKRKLEERIEERTHELTLQHNELMVHQEKEQTRSWASTGLNLISNILSGQKGNAKQLGQSALSALVKHTQSHLGAIYLLNNEDPYSEYLELMACYGFSKEQMDAQSRIEIGDGLAGSTFSDKEMKILTNIPSDYFKINSGLGDAKPSVLLIIPLSFEDKAYGVIELARFDEFEEYEKQFIQDAAISIAANIYSVRMNEQNLKHIEQFTEQAQNMNEKEEVMRQSLEELEYYREQYERLLAETKEVDSDKRKTAPSKERQKKPPKA